MATARCRTCRGSASGETFEIAKSKIDHAQGLRNGRPCGGYQENIEEVFDESPPKTVTISTIMTGPKKVEVVIEEKPKKVESKQVKPKKQIKSSKKPSK